MNENKYIDADRLMSCLHDWMLDNAPIDDEDEYHAIRTDTIRDAMDMVEHSPSANVLEIGSVKTKADRIRAMSDEKLAEWLTVIELRILQRQPMLERPALKADWLAWLGSPAEAGADHA